MLTSFYEIGAVCRRDAAEANKFLEQMLGKIPPSSLDTITEDGIFADSRQVKPYIDSNDRRKVAMWEEAHTFVANPTIYIPEDDAKAKYSDRGKNSFVTVKLDDINLHKSRIIPLAEGAISETYVDVTEILSRLYGNLPRLKDIVSASKRVCNVDLTRRYDLKRRTPNRILPKPKRKFDGYKGVRMDGGGKVLFDESVGAEQQAYAAELADWLPSYCYTTYLTEHELRRPQRGHSI